MLKNLWLKLRREWLPHLIASTSKAFLRLLMKTCRIKIQGLEQFKATAEVSPCIIMLWHNRLVMVSEILEAFASQFIYTAFVSKSRDGEPLALLAESYKSGRALRVPHNARHAALTQMIGVLKKSREVVLITPDGPRGPRYIVKRGIVVAARESGAKIVPFSWKANRSWELNTWDKMIIPKPFSQIDVCFGAPITVEKEERPENSECETALLQSALQAIS